MTHEGMVHALRRAAGLLAPAGQVIDIRALDEKAEFLVAGRHCGIMRETDDGIEYGQAERAMKEALALGILKLASEHPFTFRHHAPDLVSMRAYLADIWTDAIITPEVAAAIDEALAQDGPGSEIVLRERGWLRVLTSTSPSPRARSGGSGSCRRDRSIGGA